MKEKKKKPIYRCPCCKRFLFQGQIQRVEIKCPKCKNIVTIK